VVELGKMLPRFYEARDWNENGVPTPKKLAKLGLSSPKKLNEQKPVRLAAETKTP
jgi:hypothetical protein